MTTRVEDILSRIEASHPDGHGFFSLLETAWGSNAQLGIPAHNVRLEALHGMGGTLGWNMFVQKYFLRTENPAFDLKHAMNQRCLL